MTSPRLALTLTSDAPLDRVIDLAIQAERAGFHTIYVNESHLNPNAGFPNAFAVAAAISSQTKAAWVAVRPALGLEHPLRVVEQSNALDVLTRGRCLIVLSDDFEPLQYAAFGVPAPANGLLEEFIQRMTDAWSFEFEEEGPPLAFQSGPYSAQMAGRIMPAPCRKPHPLLARETDSLDVVLDGARRGWPIQVRAQDVAHTERLIAAYRQALASAAHSEAVVADCLRWLVAVINVASIDDVAEATLRFRASGVSELRLDLDPRLAVSELLDQHQPGTA